MQDRYSRVVPLTGLLWAVLAIIAIATGPGETPNGDSGPFKVVHFYQSHSSEIKTSGILFTIAFLAFLLFAGSLRAFLRRAPAVEPLSTLMLGAAVLITAPRSLRQLETRQRTLPRAEPVRCPCQRSMG